MAQPPDKSTFLNKLARFVANPTTEWSQLDALTSEVPEPTQMPQSELGQVELVRLQRARRKHDRRVREREFTLLRKIQASRQPEIDIQEFKSTLLNRLSMPKSEVATAQHVPPNERMFKITEINRIEQQMADQWWSSNEGAADEQTDVDLPLEAVGKEEARTQILLETQFGRTPPPGQPIPAAARVVDNGMLEFEPVSLEELIPTPPAPAEPATPAPAPAPAPAAAQQPTPATPPTPAPAPVQQPPVAATPAVAAPAAAPVPAAAPITPAAAPQAAETLPFLAGNARPGQQAHPAAHQVDTAAVTSQASMAHHGFDIAAETASSSIRLVQELPDALNEPAILFSQGKHAEVESALLQLLEQYVQTADAGQEEDVIDIRLALLDLYRSMRDEEKFDHAALELIQKSGRSPPQYWGDVSPAASAQGAQSSQLTSRFAPDTLNGAQHWVCPAELDMMSVLLLRSKLMRTTPEILLDWRPIQHIEDAALQPLLDQLRELAKQRVELIMWGATRLLQHVASLSQTAITTDGRDLCWQLRLELVRIMYRQEDFEALALEYCLDFEVSPPSWTQPHAVYVDAEADADVLAADSVPDGGSDAAPAGDAGARAQAGSVRHPRMWVGDILGPQKSLFEVAISSAMDDAVCEIDCMGLDRMDYAASADLLAWLVQRGPGSKPIRFVNTHRLLAVFWRIMGVAAQAKVELRRD